MSDDENTQQRLERIGREALTWCEASVQDEDDITEIMADDIPWMLDLISEQAEALQALAKKPLKPRGSVKLSAWVLNDASRLCRTVEGGNPNELEDLLAIAEDRLWVAWSGTGFSGDNKIERGSAGTLQANQEAATAKLLAWGFVLSGSEECRAPDLTVEDVKALLEGLTPGDWTAFVLDAQVTLGDEYARVVGPELRFRDRSTGFSPADAKIMARAPALARLVLQQRDRYVESLEKLSKDFLALDEIDRERARLVCEVVSQIDGKTIRSEDAIARIQEIYGVTP